MGNHTQSCLCSTPDLRSFHMGFALTTLSAFFALRGPSLRIKRLLTSFPRIPVSEATHCGPDTSGQHRAHTNPAAADGSVSGVLSANHRPTELPGLRPVRGNWPFTVRPPSRQPDVPTQPSPVARRSFLPTLAASSRRNTFLASLAADAAPTSAVKRVLDARSGRLVIAGRMADVCAELDRLVASEALQA